MTKTQPKVTAVDYHRNGIAGVGFKVAIVEDAKLGRMLVVDFSDEEDPSSRGYVAVLNLDMAAAGNIFMFPTPSGDQPGGNAWRGDRLGGEYRPLIRAALDELFEQQFANYCARREAQ